jgi:transglutaminase-like putative cysteine protease
MAAFYLKSTNWTTSLDLVVIALISGFGFGFLLGRSTFDPISVFWMSLSFTLVMLFLLLSLVADTSVPLVNTIFSIFYQAGISVHEYSSGIEIHSPLIILLVLIIIFWLVGLIGAYLYTRYRVISASLILIVLIFALIDYFLPEKERNPWITAIAALIGMLLYIYKNSEALVEKSKSNRTPNHSTLHWSDRLGIIFTVMMIIGIAWSIPVVVRAATAGTPEAQRFSHFSYRIQDNFARLTASLRGSARSTAISFSSNLPLGTRAAKGDSIIFTAEASQDLSAENRIYWRSKVYEIYDKGVWQLGEQKQMLLEGGTQILQPIEIPNESKVTYRVKANSSLGDYFFPGELVTINNPANLIFTPQNDGGKDIIAIEPENTVLPGFGYRVDVLFTPKSEEELINAQGKIPDWVGTRYLQIPEAIKPAVQALAEKITANTTTNYEKTKAINDFMRSNYRYNENVEIPTNGRDRIEWFLFEKREGFCNYFASAEVILLRAIGIPARLAVGFSSGEITENGLTFTVKSKNRHAWPEVFFPGEGWVIFEPTPSLPEIQYSIPENDSAVVNEGAIPDSTLGAQSQRVEDNPPENGNSDIASPKTEINSLRGRGYDSLPAVILMAGLMIIFPLILFERKDRQTKLHVLLAIRAKILELGIPNPLALESTINHSRIPDIEYVYNDTVRIGSFLFGVSLGKKTPAEIIHELVSRCPEIALEAEAMLTEYQNWVFGELETDDRKAQAMGRIIQSKMIKLKIADFYHFIFRTGSGA